MNNLIEKILENGKDLYIIEKITSNQTGRSCKSIFLLDLMTETSDEITEDSPYKKVKAYFNQYFPVTYLNQKMPSVQYIQLESLADSLFALSLKEEIRKVFCNEMRKDSASVYSYLSIHMDYRKIMKNLLDVGLNEESDKIFSYQKSIISYLEELKTQYNKDVQSCGSFTTT